MQGSTKVGMAILVGMLLGGFLLPWAPTGSGWIYLMAVVYVGLPVSVMIANDLAKLRQARSLVRNLELYPATEEDPISWADVKHHPLATEYVERWRRWFPWLLSTLGAIVIAALARQPWSPYIIGLLATVGLGREFYLAVNVVQRWVPSVWHELTGVERLRLRFCLLAMVLASGAVALGIVGLAYFFLVIDDQPLSWRHIAFFAAYGIFALVGAVHCVRYCRQLLRPVPPEERPSEREV